MVLYGDMSRGPPLEEAGHPTSAVFIRLFQRHMAMAAAAGVRTVGWAGIGVDFDGVVCVVA